MVSKGMGPGHLESGVIFTHSPSDWPSAAPPLHSVWGTSIHRPQPHFVQLTLQAHVSYAKSVSVTVLDAMDVEIKP